MPRWLPKPLGQRADVERLIKKARSRKGTIGDLCLWSASEIEIPPDRLDEMLEMNGLSRDWAPVDNRPRTVVRKALTRIRPLLEDRDSKLHVLVRKIAEDQSSLRYGLVREAVDEARFDLDYTLSNQVIFDKQNGDLTFTGAEVPEITAEYTRLLGVFTQRELLKMTQNIVLGHGAVPMRDGSGMYFLPYGMREVTEALRTLFNTEFQPYLGRGGVAFFRALGITDDEESRGEMGAIALADLTTEVTALVTGIQEAQSRVQSDGQVHPSTLASLGQRYKVAFSRLSLYQQLLQMNSSEVEAQMQQAQSAMNELLLGGEVSV